MAYWCEPKIQLWSKDKYYFGGVNLFRKEAIREELCYKQKLRQRLFKNQIIVRLLKFPLLIHLEDIPEPSTTYPHLPLSRIGSFTRSRYYPWWPTYQHPTDESAAEIKWIKKMANVSDLEAWGKWLAVSKFFAKLCWKSRKFSTGIT